MQRAVEQEGILGFINMLLDTDEPFMVFENEWELLSSDKEELTKYEHKQRL